MIENHRTELLWNLFMANPEIQPALDSIGFMVDTTTVGIAPKLKDEFGLNIYPHPIQKESFIAFQLKQPDQITISLMDLSGRYYRPILEGEKLQAGTHRIRFKRKKLLPGMYILKFSGLESETIRTIVIQE